MAAFATLARVSAAQTTVFVHALRMQAIPQERPVLAARWQQDASGRPVCAWLVRTLHPDPAG